MWLGDSCEFGVCSVQLVFKEHLKRRIISVLRCKYGSWLRVENKVKKFAFFSLYLQND